MCMRMGQYMLMGQNNFMTQLDTGKTGGTSGRTHF